MNIILIHGAWQGSWAWDALMPLLATAGPPDAWEFIAVDMPGNGQGGDTTSARDVTLALYVADLLAQIGRFKNAGRPLAIVAHSGAGVAATQLAEAIPNRVGGIAYVAGMMLPSGVGFGEIVAQVTHANPGAQGIRPHLIWSADALTSHVPEEAAREIFYHDCTRADAAAAARRLTPQPEGGRATVPIWTPERCGRVRRLYIETAKDRSVVPAAQQLMMRLVPGAQSLTLDSGHAPQLSQPRKLAECLIPWLRKIASSA